jgi:aspartate/methionine/tyrosine aminotransferase
MPELVKSMNQLQSETFSAVSSPIQYAAIEGFKDTPYLQDFISKEKQVLKVVSGIFQR